MFKLGDIMANRALELLQLISEILQYVEDTEVKEKKTDKNKGTNQTVVEYVNSPLRYKGGVGG